MSERFIIFFIPVLVITNFAYVLAQSGSPEKNSNKTQNQSIEFLLSQADKYVDKNPDSSLYYGNAAFNLSAETKDLDTHYKISKILADVWYYKGELSKAIEYYRLAADAAKERNGGNSKEYASRISDIGYCFYDLEIFDLAVEYYNQALHIFTQLNDPVEISNQLNNLGSVYFAWGNYNLAIEYFSRTLRYDIDRGDSASLSTSYNNIGKVYETWGYYDLAIEHYMKSLSFLRKQGDESRKAIRYSNIGTSYAKKNDFDKALEYLYPALQIEQQLENQIKIAVRYNEIANVLSAKGDSVSAIDYNLKALAILQSSDKKESMAIVLKDLGTIYLAMSNFQSAEDYLNRSISVSREIGSIASEMASYKILAGVFEKKGEYIKAFKYHRQYDDLKDTIFNARTHKQLANYRIKYETAKKERENEILRNDILLKKRTQRTLIIIGALMLMSVVLLFYLLREKNRRLLQDRKLHEQNNKLAALEIEKGEVEKQHLQDKVFAEKQLNRLQREKFEAEIQLKNKELVSSTLQLVNKNEVLTEIKNKIKSHNSAIPENAFKDLMQLVNQNTDFDQNWKSFRVEFEKINPGFFDRIRSAYPDFSEQFFRLAAFLRIDLSTKEIAQLMNVSVAAVNKNRQRLRKKLNLEAEADLQAFMKSI